MQYKSFGSSNESVSRIGLGCMGMSEFYGASDDQRSAATIHRALDLGISFFDTAELYGRGPNEELLGKAIRDRRDQVFLASKFGFDIREEMHPIRGDPAYVQQACEASLRRLGVDCIDLYYQHRVDVEVPIEDTVGAMAGLVEQGKVRFLGLSEAGAGTVRRAAAVHPIVALQSEYWLWSRDVEKEILPVCRELGIAFVPYSPLGRGFLTGKIEHLQSLDDNDYRRLDPRFQADNLPVNLELVRGVETLGAEKGASPAQIAIAWLLAQGDDIFPIPGTRHIDRLGENAASIEVVLNDQDLGRLAAVAGATAGQRYTEAGMQRVGL